MPSVSHKRGRKELEAIVFFSSSKATSHNSSMSPSMTAMLVFFAISTILMANGTHGYGTLVYCNQTCTPDESNKRPPCPDGCQCAVQNAKNPKSEWYCWKF
uniref:8 kDa Amblyomma family member n=1 Tax=Rhipicephalus zambeziensis TaxID=60191 RepID=A0A224Y7P5_9ACAR